MVDQQIKDKLMKHRNAILFHTVEADGPVRYHAAHYYARQEDNKIFLICADVFHDNQHADAEYDDEGRFIKWGEPYAKSSKRSRIVGFYSIDTDHFHFWTPCTMNGYRKCKYNDPAIKQLLPNNMWVNVCTNRQPTIMGDMYVRFIKYARDMAFTNMIEKQL